MGKEDVEHVYDGILLSHKNNEIMSFATTWMEPEIIIVSEVSHREKWISYDTTYMWNLKTNTNELIYRAETYIHCHM